MYASIISAAGDAAYGRMVDRLRCSRSAGDETASYYRTLSNGINLTVDPAQAGHQKQAALQTSRVAHGSDSRVDLHSRLREGGERGSYHHSRSVLYQDQAGIYRDTHFLQHVGQALRGEERLLPVTGAF